MKATVNKKAAAVAEVVSMPVVRPSIFVPLNKLVLADDQVRKTPPTKEGIVEMAAMLLAQGQLSALQVTKDAGSDQYFVHSGGRRMRGFNLLVSTGKIAPDFLVECKEVDSVEATAVGLMENISVEAMSAPDEFEAFKALVDQGRTVESIAAQYGATVLHVQRRLKLANLAPELMTAYRAGEITLDQVMALVQMDDQKRQVMVWKSLPKHNRGAWAIRRTIAEDEVPVGDPRVKLVGLKAYTAAGGGVRADLFSEKNERFCTDPALLGKLVTQAFEGEVAKVRSEGWEWVDIHHDYTYSERNKYFNMPAKLLPESEEQKAKRLALEKEYEALEAQHDQAEEDEEIDELQEKMEAIDRQLVTLNLELVDPDAQDKDLAGVVLTIEGGKITRFENLGRVSERKQIMASIEARKRRAASLSGDQEEEGGGAPEAPAAKVDAIPEKLMMNLSAHRTAAIQACMVTNQKVTLAALAQRMAMSVFGDLWHGGDECIKITRTSAWHVLEKSSPTVGTSLAATVMTEERTRWEQLLPTDKKTWLQYFIDQPLEHSLSMIVFGTAESVNALQSRVDSKDGAADLANALDLDMKAWWEPTLENYIDLVPKAAMIKAVTEAKGSAWAKDMPKLKKDEAGAFAFEALAGTGWLPLPLRPVGAAA